MNVAVFSTKQYERAALEEANRAFGHHLVFFEPRLVRQTAPLAAGFEAVCVFVNDQLDGSALETLAATGTQLVALRCAGFNNVDLAAAERLGITVVRVPAYSPHAVAEHTVALLLALNRKIHRANSRVREGNFSLEGLVGFDLHGRTVGVVGTGKIGIEVVRIMRGFGCRVLASDPYPNDAIRELGVPYVEMDELLASSDIITLHCPLTPDTYHLIDVGAVDRMKDGVFLINTSRGALIDTRAVIRGLKSGRIGNLAIDVYEEEADLFFEDLSGKVIQDDVFARLMTFPNVLITGHQAFLTTNALGNIAQTTLGNITSYEQSGEAPNAVRAEVVVR